MSIQRIPIFLAAAEELNFTKAAESQHISQTAVSQQIKLLEEELGFQLFIRDTRSVKLTDAGQVFYRQCRHIMTQYNTAVIQGQKIASQNDYNIRVGYAGAYELWSSSKYLREYCNRWRDAKIDMISGTNQQLMQMLTDGKIDIAIVSGFGTEVDSWLTTKTISSVPCLLMISEKQHLAKQKVISPCQLVDFPIVLNRVQDSVAYRVQTADMYRFLGLSGNKQIYVDDFYSLATLVSLGQAIAVVPADIKCWGIDGIAYIPIKNFRPKAHILLVYARNTSSPAAKNFLDIVSGK